MKKQLLLFVLILLPMVANATVRIWKNGISYDIQLAHDMENDRYMLVCSDSIPKAFDKKKLAKGQFEIEY